MWRPGGHRFETAARRCDRPRPTGGSFADVEREGIERVAGGLSGAAAGGFDGVVHCLYARVEVGPARVMEKGVRTVPL